MAVTFSLFMEYVIIDDRSSPAISPLNHAQGAAEHVRNVLVNL